MFSWLTNIFKEPTTSTKFPNRFYEFDTTLKNISFPYIFENLENNNNNINVSNDGNEITFHFNNNFKDDEIKYSILKSSIMVSGKHVDENLSTNKTNRNVVKEKYVYTFSDKKNIKPFIKNPLVYYKKIDNRQIDFVKFILE